MSAWTTSAFAVSVARLIGWVFRQREGRKQIIVTQSSAETSCGRS